MNDTDRWLERYHTHREHLAWPRGLIGVWLGQQRKPALAVLVEDVQAVMLGPAWLLSVIYRRLGIPY